VFGQRAIAEQVHGPREGDHAVVRREVVEFMRANVEDFEPFVENDETFHSYTQRMSTAGTWWVPLGVTFRARWVTLHVRARWVTFRARWVTLRARWVTL
jgi:hypothetical protein